MFELREYVYARERIRFLIGARRFLWDFQNSGTDFAQDLPKVQHHRDVFKIKIDERHFLSACGGYIRRD